MLRKCFLALAAVAAFAFAGAQQAQAGHGCHYGGHHHHHGGFHASYYSAPRVYGYGPYYGPPVVVRRYYPAPYYGGYGNPYYGGGYRSGVSFSIGF